MRAENEGGELGKVGGKNSTSVVARDG
jgi:hypothetical protein